MTDVPREWACVPLGELVEVLDSRRIPVSAKLRADREGDVPYYGATGKVGTIDDHIFDEDLVLLGEDGIQFFDPAKPKAYRITGRAWVNNHAHVLRPRRHRVDDRYLMHYLNQCDYRGYANGTTRLKLTQAAMNGIPVVLPPLEEQRRIVDILEDHLSRLDAGVEGVRRVPNRLAALRLSALTHQRKRLLDDGASLRAIGDVAETALGKMLDAKRSHGVPTPYLRNINVRWGVVDVGDVQTVPLSEDERAKFALEPGDLLVCEGGEPGRCAVWPGSEGFMTFQKALHRVRVRDEATTDIRYVALMLEEFIRSGRADTMYTGTTIRHLPQEKLRLVTIPLPPLEEQVGVVNSMMDLTDSMDLASDQADTAVRRAATLRRSLLAAAFSGRLIETTSATTSEVPTGV